VYRITFGAWPRWLSYSTDSRRFAFRALIAVLPFRFSFLALPLMSGGCLLPLRTMTTSRVNPDPSTLAAVKPGSVSVRIQGLGEIAGLLDS
jgi:hypothetical protein